MKHDVTINPGDEARPAGFSVRLVLRLLWRDKFATIAALFLILVILAAAFGPALFGDAASMVNLRARNAPPSLSRGWSLVLGADALGRPILLRLIVGAQNTIWLASCAVAISLLLGSLLGFMAGYRNDWASSAIMRLADVLMSFPSLLLALTVLYVFSPSVAAVILVLAVTRIPVFLRVSRAQVLEARERTYVTAARLMGATPQRLIWRHIRPTVMPTLLTIATLEIAFVMLAESSLSFLGVGIQAPEFTWGAMVAQGQNYLTTAWWVAFWPGLAITLTAMSLNLVASWLRVVGDPVQRWRLEAGKAPGNG